MKLKQIIIFSIDFFLSNRKNKIIFIMLLASSFFMVGLLVTSRAVVSYAWKDCNAILKKGIEETGLVSIAQFNTPEGETLLKSAWQTGAFESIGGFTYPMGVDDRLFELWGMQKQFANSDISPQYLWWINIDEFALELCDLEYEQIETISENKRDDADWFGIILGGNYTNVPVGTTFEEEIIPGHKWKYEVVGVLKKNTRMISGAVLNMGKGNSFQSTILLDDYILRINTGPSVSSSWAYTMKDGLSLKDGKNTLEEIAKQNDMDLTYALFSDGFEMDESDQRIVNEVLLQILVLVIITTFFINLFVFLLFCFNRLNEIGIFYANGFLFKDMIKIQLAESFMDFSLAFVISWLVLSAYLKNQGGNMTAMQQGVRYLLGDIAWPSMLTAYLIFYVFFNLIPVIVIRNSSPVSLVRYLKG